MSYLDSYARPVVSGEINIRDVPLNGQHTITVHQFFLAIMAEIVKDYQKLREEIKADELAFRAGAEAMREMAAYVAREACLMPPDGGSPSEEEREMCAEAARQIYAIALPSSAVWWRRCEEAMARIASGQFGVAWHDVQEAERDEWRSAIRAALKTVRGQQ